MEKIGTALREKFEISLSPRWKTKGYTAISNSLILNKKLSQGSKVVQMYLLIRCMSKDYTYPSYETISKDIGMPRRSVARHLVELKEEGLIKIQHRRNKTNIYFLKF